MAAQITVQRENDEKQDQNLLATDLAEEALTRMHLNGTRIDQALNQLNNQDLDKLAARAGQAAATVSGARLSNRRLLYLVIALATAGMVLITT